MSQTQHNGLKIDWEDFAWDHGFNGDDEEMLFQMYHVQRLTMEQIGDKIGICATTISRRMRDLKIEVRPTRNHNSGRGPRLPGSRRK